MPRASRSGGIGAVEDDAERGAVPALVLRGRRMGEVRDSWTAADIGVAGRPVRRRAETQEDVYGWDVRTQRGQSPGAVLVDDDDRGCAVLHDVDDLPLVQPVAERDPDPPAEVAGVLKLEEPLLVGADDDNPGIARNATLLQAGDDRQGAALQLPERHLG